MESKIWLKKYRRPKLSFTDFFEKVLKKYKGVSSLEHKT